MSASRKPLFSLNISSLSQGLILASLVSTSAHSAGDEMLRNAAFGGGTDGWWSTGAELVIKDGEACMDIKRAGSNPWDVILGQRGFGLEEGESYSIDFTARANKNTAFTTLIQHEGAPYTQYFNQAIEVSTEPKAFSFTFTQEVSSDAKTEFQFQLGAQQEANVCFSNISVKGKSFVIVNNIPKVRLNQLGFFPTSEKFAVINSDSQQPIFWQLKDAKGEVLANGKTQVFGENKSSGENVHRADFSRINTPQTGLTLESAGQSSHPFSITEDLYGKLKHDALAYFYQNRSGIEVKADFVQRANLARPAGHPSDVVSCFDKADDKGNQWPGCDFDMDLTGGWYDAGDHGKYVVNGGISTWTLMNLYERSLWIDGAPEPFADGKQAIPEAGNGVNDLLDEARWNMEFMLAMQIPEGKKVFVPVGNQQDNLSALKLTEIDASGLAFHKVADEKWTGMPLPPHKDTQKRYVGQPSTAATLNLAATAAQCARIWKEIDADFSAQCSTAASRAWQAAAAHPEVYAYDNFTGSGPYGDTELADEFYWAAAELFISTGEEQYLEVLKASPAFLAAPLGDETAKGDLFWQDLSSAGTLSLALVPSKLDEATRDKARAKIIATADGYSAQLAKEGYHIPYTAEQYPWGSNSNLVNRGIFLTYAADYSGDSKYMQALVHAMDYILGRNPLDQSYITGYGSNPLKNPHHRFWAHQADENSPKPAPGALSGGPNSISFSDPVAAGMKGKCIGQTCFVDEIGAWTLNEITINWNAPLVWVSSVLDEHRLAK
ncbi:MULTISPECIES: glycoside hydrolase family 9 protein [unclassified Agarivorans]|uniref:glycoside hydrolase family 9 protein n=1 Tax=unclassified Agarivorans TaxID=2636026 RepID=UPI0026E16D5C|nr:MULTISPECIES: glycoside hydrolase family 9 protein [unclassified Agarivorans]MDO6687460.1 glycoside hydrolase family 9 protein [Agarivorans sp. 3_MG-2023]MDO6715226.1 glycoside hydrolase family 9 protein [Agarivorans sp. 2_MG-2023]MDO6763477.1 glycoside hydrolase family 9 protein [Agarivorans sp. 1_MG-2023]